MKILLSFVIEYILQNILPATELVGIVKPIFAQCRQDIVVDDGTKPFFRTYVYTAEIAVTDAEAFAQRLIKGYFTVQILNMGYQCIKRFIVQLMLILNKAG